VLALAWAFLVSTFARMLYFGLEPFVRRAIPYLDWLGALIGGRFAIRWSAATF